MIHGNLICLSLLAVLVDRFALDKRIGKTPFSSSSTNLVRRLPDTGIVVALLCGGAIGSWLLTSVLLIPLGAASCSLPAYLVTVLGLAMGGEALLARWWQFEVLNRIFTRAAILSSLLGAVALMPWPGDHPGAAASFLHSIKTALLTGMIFAVVRMFYDGVMEKAGVFDERQSGKLLARELAAAALVALALGGVSAVNFLR
jgi:Na+-translocating ferredoxin:NAD+ oxidoreductase RnfA subunit